MDKYSMRWRLGRLRRRRGGGRAAGSLELRRPNRVLGRAHEGGVVGPEPRGQAQSVMLVTAVAAAAEDDGAVGIIWCGAVVGEERSPLGRGPLEPPDSKIGHKRRQSISSWSISRKNRTHNRLLSYGDAGRLAPS